MVKKSCLFCNKTFETYDKRQRYCKRKCYRESTKKFKRCLICGKKFGGQKKQGKKFCSTKCYGVYRRGKFSGKNHNSWKGGVTYAGGYKYVYKPKHPYCCKKGYVMEHRLIMEQHLGRYLDPTQEVIHHIDEDKLNNNIKNLKLMTRGEHLVKHKIYSHRQKAG